MIKATTMPPPTTLNRKQRLQHLLSRRVPVCTSTQWKHEYYKILWMLRELLDCHPWDVRQIWMINLLSEALTELHEINDPTSTPTDSRKEDNCRWTAIMVRRLMAEQLWDEGQAVTFYDCYETLKEGRTKAASLRLWEQTRITWERVTGTDLSTEFSLAA